MFSDVKYRQTCDIKYHRETTKFSICEKMRTPLIKFLGPRRLLPEWMTPASSASTPHPLYRLLGISDTPTIAPSQPRKTPNDDVNGRFVYVSVDELPQQYQYRPLSIEEMEVFELGAPLEK